AERIRRTVAAVEPNLMCPISIGEVHPVVLCQLEATTLLCMGHHLGARYTVGIKLVIPCRVERVGPIYPLAVSADLHHLRTACICLDVRMRRAPGDAANV